MVFILLICNLVKIFANFVTAAAEMPDAMEIIFQKALAFGTSGAVSNNYMLQVCSCLLYKYINALLVFASFR